MADLLEMKQNNNELNENYRPVLGDDLYQVREKIKILFQYNNFSTKLSFYERKLEIKMKLLKLY